MKWHLAETRGAKMDDQIDPPTSRGHHRKPVYVPEDPLLTALEAAAERRQALSTFWRDVKRGIVPAPYYVSPRCPRWRRSELRSALEACRGPRQAIP
jgi:predicted DNA-binding transcriptional regulator AlpA